MSKRYAKLATMLLTFILAGGLFAQTTCFFVSESTTPGVAGAADEGLVTWLQGLGYDVYVATGDELNTGFYTKDDIREYDFAFVSESISSSDGDSLKGAPIPVFTTEMWGAKWDINGWVPNNTSVTYYENATGEGDNVISIIDGSHALAAGFAQDAQVTIVTGTDDANNAQLTYCRPGINYLPIGGLANDETAIVVLGVEAGTAIYEAQHADGESPDGSVTSENRAAGVGINATANGFITDDALTLIEAGIKWILEEPTALDSEPVVQANSYQLDQNYPNPFNPLTHISYTLERGGFVNLTVYDILGQEVAVLVNGISAAGLNMVNFDASKLKSGVYFYKLTAGSFSQTKKMTLVK